MTTIIAVENEKGVTFASDSRISGWGINDGWVSKVVKNGAITFGAAGYLRTIQVLQYAKLTEPPADATPEGVDRYVSLELVPAIVSAFKEVASEESLKRSVILLAVAGRVYEVSSDGAWTRTADGFYAVGSGSMYALGALAAGAKPAEAIKIASRYDWGTNADAKELKLNKQGQVRKSKK
ncbi:protease [Microbacterium phage Pumpernickel]|uniref:Protease n=1 Tax=Microbacterium phage Pumpernickel TaxID=2885983 RepID=A0AAE8Y8D4_9CAUD|nr:protease [Microbacterium phage Pumpernickel]UDL15913.1 protease [Microbacterium phage Pumpernickel]